MAEQGYKPVDIIVDVPSTATAKRVSDERIVTPIAIIQADPDNTNYIYVGSSSVSSSLGIQLAPGATYSLTGPSIRGSDNNVDLSDWYIATDTAGNDARIQYLVKKN